VDAGGFLENLWWYTAGALNWGAGLPILIMAILGLIWSLTAKNKKNSLFLLFPIIYLITICSGKFRWDRYAVALMPFIAVYSAIFLHNLWELIFTEKRKLKGKTLILLMAVGIIIGKPLYNIIRYDYLLTQKDTRILTKEWMESNIPQGSKIGQDAYTGELSEAIFSITRQFSLSVYPLKYYIENDYQYLLVSDTQYNRYLAEPEKYPENVGFYKTLFSECALVQEFIPDDSLWPYPENRFSKYHIHISPTIKIYRINKI
jgi:hypothetical protein